MVRPLQSITFIALFFISFNNFGHSDEKKAVFIVGMGRSGTSCTAGVLKILGLELGSPLAGPGSSNKKGKFEHLPTTQLMQPILKQFDTIWWNPRLIDWSKATNQEELKNKVKKHLDHYFGRHAVFGIKNPEITMLLPLFLQAAEELGYTPKIIIVVRHPDETNASFQKELGQSQGNFYRNICLAYACAFKYCNGYDTHVVYFSDLINNTEQTVNELKEFLPELKDYKTAKRELSKFIDKDLKHHNAQEDQ